MLKTRENGEVITVGILASNKTKDVKWLGDTLLGQETRKSMLELYPTATGSDMAEDEIQANMALMAFTDSEYDDLLVKLDDTGFKAATYKRGLSILEAQVVKYKESEVLFSEEIALLKRSVGQKEYLMGLLKTELEKVKEEKEGLAILGVDTPPEDLNVMFLRCLPSEWDTYVVVWMNKPDFETMGLDDLYNNFKIVEQKVKRTVAANNDDKNLAFLTTSSPSSTNTINTVNTGVSTGNTKVNTASTETSTASFSDATVYAFLSTQPQGSQLVHEDLEQLHDDDLEEMDLKWNMALLSMRARKFYQRTGRKIIIDGSSTARYDKSKVERSSSKAVRIEDTFEKAMCAIDDAGFDWSDMAEDEIQANMALMAFTDYEISNDKSCSKSCLQNYKALKKQYDDLLVKLDDTGFKAATYKRGLSILEAQVVKYKESEVLFSEEIALLKRSVVHKEYLMGLLKTELEKVKEEKEGFEFKLAKFEKSSKDLDALLASQVTDKSKKGFGYNAVPSPHPLILNRPTSLDLSYSGLEEFKQPEVNEYGLRDSRLKPTTVCNKESDNSKENTDDSLKQQHKTVIETSSVKSPLKADKAWKEKFFHPANHVRIEEPKKARENSDAPIIEDWVSDDEEEVEPIPQVEKNTTIPTATKKESVKTEKPIRKSVSCPNAHKHMVPRVVLMKTGQKTVNNARPVNTVRSVNTARPFSTARAFNTVRPSYTAYPKSTVLCARPKIHFQNQAQSTVQRPFYKKTAITKRSKNQNINTGRQTVNTVRPNVNTVRARGFNAVKPSACWVWRPIKPNGASLSNSQLNDKGFVDSGCSRHMSGNIAHLSDFKDFDGGYVTFGGGANGGRITGKGTIKTDKLDFEDVYFVKELKFNLFSVSQMCDKKNYVLFTDSECLVLSPNFKLPDENQILLKIPRQNNMYNFDMKNIVPKDGLTCLVAKATSEESMLWHRRLGHVNFKNINKLVKENLVRDLPLKRFENDQTCVACLKGKQHRASCKTKAFSPITKPLFMLHMDLFGPTFVSSLMHKKYCLVVTDDYSRFSWVFFLRTKDETSEILKNFIKEIENLVDKKVKIIRSDNGTEFKNHVMDEFCREKGIKREYSVARTPQQNGVAERKNRTLIEAARTMLADSKLPTTFWAEAVSTACYLLASLRHLVQVTILNTLDKLGKFDGKSDEGFFVGYSLSSKAFRVYNIRTRKVQENLHVGFLENKPMLEGNGPKWLFDLDSLTQSMNYVPVVAGTFSNVSAGIQGVSESSTSTQQDQDCIFMPIWKDASYFDDASLKSIADVQIQDQDGTHDDCSFQDNGIDDHQVNTASPQVNTGSREISTAAPEVNTNSQDHTINHVIEEPKRVSKALSDPAWVEAMQEELLQFKLQNVWVLVDLPKGHRAIGTKWVYRNKKDERGIGLKILTSDKVYKVVKALYGLHQAPRAWSNKERNAIFISQDKYVHEILRKFNYTDVKSASTPTDLEKPLVSGLWYSKDSPLELVSYTDSDYAGATLDRKSTTGGSLRRHLKLDDQDGITSLPTTEIFAQLALMGYTTDSDKFIQLCLDMQRHKLQQHTRFYSVPSLTMKVFSNMKRSTKGFSGQDVALFPTMLDDTEPSPSPSRITSSPSPTPSPSPEPSPTQPSPTQPTPTQPSPTQLSPTQPGTEYHLPTPHDSPLHAVHSHGSDEGSLKLQELMNLVTTLSDRIGVLEADLLKTKKTYSSAYTKLILRGRKFSDEEVQEKASADTELFIQEVTPTEVIQDQEGSGKASDEVSTAGLKKGPVSEEVPTVSTAEVTLSTAGGTVTYSRRSAEKRSRKDKGKAILIEEEPKKKSKKELEQEQLSYAEAIRLEEQMNEEQRAQIARDEEIARQWDEEERKRAMDAAKSTKKIDWNDPSVIRYHSLKMKPKTIAQARRNMIKYLKNQGNYKISDFKGMSYNDIRPIFEKIWDFNQNIKPMDAEQGSGKQKSPQKSPEKSPAKEKSPEKVVEEESETQEELKEGVKEPATKRKSKSSSLRKDHKDRDIRLEDRMAEIICQKHKEIFRYSIRRRGSHRG
ncbi:putative ribonuclease H-like domain-containing protein [Tanacetum coccineum]